MTVTGPIRSLDDCPPFIAGDGTTLRELFNPATSALPFGYSLAHATVAPRGVSQPHRLASAEVYYVLSGEGRIHLDDAVYSIAADDAVSIPPGTVQWVENMGDAPLCFLCMVDPAWRAEDETVL